jgi:hypothetical protein
MRDITYVWNKISAFRFGEGTVPTVGKFLVKQKGNFDFKEVKV